MPKADPNPPRALMSIVLLIALAFFGFRPGLRIKHESGLRIADAAEHGVCVAHQFEVKNPGRKPMGSPVVGLIASTSWFLAAGPAWDRFACVEAMEAHPGQVDADSRHGRAPPLGKTV